MATDNNNPFILPGLGQTGDLAQNPIIASMEMMRQAWQGLAGAGGIGAGPLTPPLSTEDLDRRINDLRAVENWLRMNLSMLTSTIQGLEVQSATLATLKSFMPAAASAASASHDGPSPLEVALGMRRPDQNAAPAAEPRADSAAASASPPPEAGAGTEAGSSDQPGIDPGAYAAQATAAAQGWWDMLQKQFDTLAAATAATLEGAQAAGQEAQSMAAPGQAAKRATAPRKTAAKTARKTATKTAAPKAPKKAAASTRNGGAVTKTSTTRGRSGTGAGKTST